MFRRVKLTKGCAPDKRIFTQNGHVFLRNLIKNIYQRDLQGFKNLEGLAIKEKPLLQQERFSLYIIIDYLRFNHCLISFCIHQFI